MWIVGFILCVLGTILIAFRSTRNNFFTWFTVGMVMILSGILYLLTFME